MMLFVITSIIFLMCKLSFLTADNPSSYYCSNQSKWWIDETITTEAFQSFIFYKQHLCKNRIFTPVINSAGIGATTMHIMSLLIDSWQQNGILRPNDVAPYLYASLTEKNCTLHIRAVDCFHNPLSTCGHSNKLTLYEQKSSLYSAKHLKLMMSIRPNITLKPIGICYLGFHIKRSIQWIQGQLLLYIWRQREDIQLEINLKTVPFFNTSPSIISLVNNSSYSPDNSNSNNNSSKITTDNIYYHYFNRNVNYNSSTMAIHIRTGHGEELDNQRKYEPPLEVYIEAMDIFAKSLELSGKPLSAVYLCSTNPKTSYISTEYMSLYHPRPFRYYSLPHISIGKGDPFFAHQRNMFDVMNGKRRRKNLNYTNYDIHVEFYTDMQIFMNVDVFIGSTSTIYDIISLIRQSKGHEPNTTCYISLVIQNSSMHCEDSPDAINRWMKNIIPSRSYNGGTIFSF